MKIARYRPDNWVKDHPTGAIAFQHLLRGDPGSPDNFMLILGRQDGDFHMPRHRHNFDQIRLPIVGPMDHGDFVLGEGEVGYFVEGLAYGPQDDPLGRYAPGERLQLVLQFGGASGVGFMSIEDRRRGREELSRTGRFEGNYYHRADGKTEWGLNAIWRQVYGAPLTYPKPRYRSPIVADPAAFTWRPVEQSSGVEHKLLGVFSERAVWAEMVRLAPGAAWRSSDTRSRRLMVVMQGEAATQGERLVALDAVQSEPGERLTLASASGAELFLIGLPPVHSAAAAGATLLEAPIGEGAL